MEASSDPSTVLEALQKQQEGPFPFFVLSSIQVFDSPVSISMLAGSLQGKFLSRAKSIGTVETPIGNLFAAVRLDFPPFFSTSFVCVRDFIDPQTLLHETSLKELKARKALQEELDVVKQQLQDARNDVDGRAGAAKEMETELEKLRSELQQQEQQLAELRKDNSEKQESATLTQQLLQDKQEEVDRLLKEKLAEITAKEDAQGSSGEKMARIDELELQVEALSVDAAKKTDEASKAQKLLSEKQAETDSILAAREAEIETLTKRVAELTGFEITIETLEESLTDVQIEVNFLCFNFI